MHNHNLASIEIWPLFEERETKKIEIKPHLINDAHPKIKTIFSEHPEYRFLFSRHPEYLPKKITTTSLQNFFIYAQLLYISHIENNDQLAQYHSLQFAYLLLQHCLLNKDVYDIQLSNERYIDQAEQTIEEAYTRIKKQWNNIHSISQNIQNTLSDERTPLRRTPLRKKYLFQKQYSRLANDNPFTQLPDETLVLIMSFLKIEDLVYLSKVNRLFNRLSQTEMLWDTLESNLAKELNYIMYYRNQNELINQYFLISSKNRIADFYLKFEPSDIINKVDEKLNRYPRYFAIKQACFGETTSDGICFCSSPLMHQIFCYLTLIGILTIGVYTGYTAYNSVYTATYNNDPNDKTAAIFAGLSVGLIAGLMGSAVSGIGILCAELLVYGLFQICCRGSAYGIDKTIDHLHNNARLRLFNRFRITDSQLSSNPNTFYASLRTRELSYPPPSHLNLTI